MNNDYFKGRLIATALAILKCYVAIAEELNKGAAENCAVTDAANRLMDTHEQELLRLVHNETQLHSNTLDDPVMLSMMIIALCDGYVPQLPEIRTVT